MEVAGYGSNTAHRAPGQDYRSQDTDTAVDPDSAPSAGGLAVRLEPAGHRTVVARDHSWEVAAVRTGVRPDRDDPGSTGGLRDNTGQTWDRSVPAGTHGRSTSPEGTGCRVVPRSSWAPGAAVDSASGPDGSTGSVDRTDRNDRRTAIGTKDRHLSTGHRCPCCPQLTKTAVGLAIAPGSQTLVAVW